MKKLLTIIIFILSTVKVFAEGSNSQQTVQLSLLPVIEFNSANRQGIDINVKTINTQAFSIKSNKNFKITVNTTTADQNVKLSLVDNKTTGAAATNSNNMPLSATAQDIITNCSRGEQSFAVNCKTKSGAVVVYTATQM